VNEVRASSTKYTSDKTSNTPAWPWPARLQGRLVRRSGANLRFRGVVGIFRAVHATDFAGDPAQEAAERRSLGFVQADEEALLGRVHLA
jgi:hypothetical protein